MASGQVGTKGIPKLRKNAKAHNASVRVRANVERLAADYIARYINGECA